MKLVIVLPTYSERENVRALIPMLQKQLLAVPYAAHILVVDDNSPDGTGEVVRSLMHEWPNVHLITGQKQGLGVAYIRGMKHALEVLAADVIVEMDADFSHDPADLPRLLKMLDLPADFVIGSRYVSGGSIPKSWSWQRKTTSRLGNFVARYVAGLYHVQDCTAGYRVIRSSVLRQIDFGALRVKGYAFQIALLHRAVSVGATVVEAPVHFADRELGDSKLGLEDIIEFLINAWWIRLWSARTFIIFCVVGASGVAVNLAAFSGLLASGILPYIASPLAVELSILWNFILNNLWTFRHRPKSEHVSIRGLKFNIVSIATLVVTFVTFVIVSRLFSHWPLQLDQLVAILPTTAVNYFLNSYWIFKRKEIVGPLLQDTAGSSASAGVRDRSTLS